MKERRDFIGGSDIAAIMGMSRWASPLQLWAYKTGEVDPRDISHIEAVQLGTELEDFVAQKFSRETGLSVRRAPKHYSHSEYPYMRCQVDRLITGTEDLLECKTCSAWKAKEWEGEEIPGEYILQVIWQLGITGRKNGYIAVLIGGQSFVHKKIEFDEELFSKMIESAKAFWQMVQDMNPPMATGADNQLLTELYPGTEEEIAQADDLNDKVAYLQEIKMHIKELDGQKKEVEAEIKNEIKDNLGIKTPRYIVKWIPQQRASMDIPKLKEDGLYDKYTKIKKLRVLRVTNNKEAQNEQLANSKK